MAIFLTLAIYSVRIASDFPTQSDYIPIISIYFKLGLLFTYISLLWFAYAEYLRTKKEVPKIMVKMANLVACFPLISWVKRHNKIVVKSNVESLDKPNNHIQITHNVAMLNFFVFSILLSTSLI